MERELAKGVSMVKVAYLDCSSGISGDMTLAALVDAGVELESLNRAVGSLGLPGLRLRTAEVTKLGFRATQVNVESEPEHATSLSCVKSWR